MSKPVAIILWVLWSIAFVVALGPPLLGIGLLLVQLSGNANVAIVTPSTGDLILLAVKILALAMAALFLWRRTRTAA